jgi:small subunit ribosomal protein S20
MAHSRQAKKRVRQTQRRTLANKTRMSRVRTFIRRVETAIAGGDHEAARAALRAAQPEIMRGVSKGVLKRNTAARRVSRLSRQVKAMLS